MRSPAAELAERSAVGDVYLRRLVRAQLGLNAVTLVAFGGIVGGLPLALLLVPGLAEVDVLGVPAALWLVGVPLFPFLLGVGWLHQRRADALDEAFGALVRDDEP